jgi:3-hydroxyisobutyrate dehydrogenase
MADNPTVAVLGIGTMGAGMARNIAAAGMPVRVWNRTRERAEALADVAEVCDTPGEAAKGADVVVTIVRDAASVEEAIRAAAEGFPEVPASVVWMQSATVGVAGAIALEELADELGVRYVDAPVLGTKKPAEDGALTVLASGDSDLAERVLPVCQAIGARTMWVGPAVSGSRLKLAVNSWVATVIEGVAESLAFTKALGLDPQLLLDALKGGALDAPYVQVKGGMMLAGEFPPSFTVDGVVKDVDLMLAAAADTDFEPRLLPVIHRQFRAAADQDLGEQDMAAVYRSLDG